MAVLGLDIGTTGVKGIAFSPEGAPLASAYQRYALIQPKPGWAELDTKEVSAAILNVIRSAASTAGKGSITAICSTALGDAVVPVDDQQRPLDNSIIAIDHRAERQTAAFAGRISREEFFRVTGQLQHPIASLFKLLWWKEERPQVFAGTRRFFCWNEMLAVLLGVPPAISPSLAVRTGMYDLAKAGWSERILEAAELSSGLLAPIAPAGAVLGEVSSATAADLGLGRGCVLVSGGWDQACAALGAGACEPGVIVNSMGTTDSLNATFRGIVTTESMMESGLTCTPHPIGGLFCPNAFSTGGGNILSYIVRPPVSLQKLLVDQGGRTPWSIALPTATISTPTRRSSPPSSFWSRSSSTCPTRAADSFAPTGCTPLGLVARGPVALTSSASLPRVGSASINPSHPPASVRPTSRSQSCRCRPGTAAPHGPA